MPIFPAAVAALQARLGSIPNVLATPAVEVEILEFNLLGPVLAVRPYCHNDHYWQVYFDTNKAIREVLGSQAFPPRCRPRWCTSSSKPAATLPATIRPANRQNPRLHRRRGLFF